MVNPLQDYKVLKKVEWGQRFSSAMAGMILLVCILPPPIIDPAWKHRNIL